MNNCFQCGHHNLDCYETFDSTECYDFFAITAKYDPNRAIRNSEPKRRATEFEQINAKLDRIERNQIEILSYLAPKLSKRESAYNTEPLQTVTS